MVGTSTGRPGNTRGHEASVRSTTGGAEGKTKMLWIEEGLDIMALGKLMCLQHIRRTAYFDAFSSALLI